MEKRKDYSKIPIEERKKMVERIYVIHPRNKAVLDKFAYCHQHAKIAAEPDGMLLEGIAGMGKTTLCKYYMRDFPRRQTEDGTIVPVLMTKVEVPVSPKSLVTALLKALGDPLPDKGSAVSQTLRFRKLMKDCGVELVFLDEFQHFIDRDSKKVLKTISDWLKNLMDDTGKPIILVGMPNSHVILDEDGNEQLKRRFLTRIKLEAFDWKNSEDKEDFRKFLLAVDEKIPLNEWSNFSSESMAFRLYLASDGIVSKVMKLIRRATAIALDLSKEILDLETLCVAYEDCLAANDPEKENPFAERPKKMGSQSAKKDKSAKRATNARSKAKKKDLGASDVL